MWAPKFAALTRGRCLIEALHLLEEIQAYRNFWTLDARVGRCSLDAGL